ncbi:DUF775-domain-containing protein [Favolaschia claudopus]|uniref:DUF775-domain-containing protein n=1 Tax=Favolaschia claudopus TaxID=2862362 RepID=A0AAW0DWZ5_9AGAR
MFGCCVAGRLLQTNLQQVDETHALFELQNASAINHMCVFLLGTVFFPDGYGCTVHLYWPGRGFQLLGSLSNDKPSAIFRLRGTFTSHQPASTMHSALSSASAMQQDAANVTAILGFSVEPLADIVSQLANLSAVGKPESLGIRDPLVLAERVVKNLFNYVAGFTGGAVSGDVAVPMTLIMKWYESFAAKVRNTGVGFLERGDD